MYNSTKLWASEGGEGGLGSPWSLKLLAKKVVFSIPRSKKQFSPLLAPPWRKIWENPLLLPPWKKSFRRPWAKCVTTWVHKLKGRERYSRWTRAWQRHFVEKQD